MNVVQIRPGPFSEEDILHWFPWSAILTSASDLTWLDEKPTLPRCNFQNLRQPLLVNLKSSQVWLVIQQPNQLWQSIACDSRKGLWGFPISGGWPPLQTGLHSPCYQYIIHDLCRKSCPLNLFDWSRILKMDGKWMFSGYLTSPSWRGTILWKDLSFWGLFKHGCSETSWANIRKSAQPVYKHFS